MLAVPNPAKVEKTDIKLENSQVHCARCEKPFEGYKIAELQGVKRLMSPDTVIYHTKMACIHCGEFFRWNEDEKSLKNDAKKFIEILSVLHGQK